MTLEMARVLFFFVMFMVQEHGKTALPDNKWIINWTSDLFCTCEEPLLMRSPHILFNNITSLTMEESLEWSYLMFVVIVPSLTCEEPL